MQRATVVTPETVEAQINYLAPGSFINRRFVAPGEEANTGRYEPHTVRIGNARLAPCPFTLDEHGFTLATHKSQVLDFLDREEVDACYPDEAVELVKQLTGADLVVPMGWMIRTSGDLSSRSAKVEGFEYTKGLQPPAGEAHVDMTAERAERLAQTTFANNFPDERPFRRFLTSSVWRAFSEPPQDWPLALCDGRTVSDEEGVANRMIIVDKLPGEQERLAEVPGEEDLPAAAVFRFSPDHQWWYFPDMTRDEVLMFKFHDSEKTRAWRTPHTAFHDSSRTEAKIRQSIEFRSVAYFLE